MELTSTEAATLLRVDRATTRKAASSGQVEGAYREPRPGTINAPWVAAEVAWRNWFNNRHRVGRPSKKEVLLVAKHFEELSDGFRQHMSYVEALMQTASDGPLEDLENAILVARMLHMAKRLNAAGFQTMTGRTFDDHEVQFNLILVYNPGDGTPAEWATLIECRRLLDTVANLPPAEAFKRWCAKIEPTETLEYTEQDAKRDTQLARAALQRRCEVGEISAEDYAIEHRAASFMDLAPRK